MYESVSFLSLSEMSLTRPRSALANPPEIASDFLTAVQFEEQKKVFFAQIGAKFLIPGGMSFRFLFWRYVYDPVILRHQKDQHFLELSIFSLVPRQARMPNQLLLALK